MPITATSAMTTALPRQHRLAAAAFAATLGLTLIFFVGFARSEIMHNAAHDLRHASNFPCH